MIHKLMIKTHNETGLKYLCYTTQSGKDYKKYKGSGTRWKRHLKKHGNNINTELIFETDDKFIFKKIATEKSIEFNVVESKDWANIRIEDGAGGDTVSKNIWITNGIVDKYHLKTIDIPMGWFKGRTKCAFNNPEIQKELSNRQDRTTEKYKESRKIAGQKISKNRDHSKCGVKGELNSSKRPEVREKISKKIIINNVLYKSCTDASIILKVSLSTISYWLKKGKASLCEK